MGDNQIVTISDAARMIPYSRKTLYKHLKQGKLSTTRFLDGRKGIYISELVRCYGGRLIPLEQVKKEEKPVTKVTSGNNSDKLDILLKKIESLESEVQSLRKEISSKKMIEHKPAKASQTGGGEISTLMQKILEKSKK